MAKKAMVIGELLFVLGIVAYFIAEKKSPTAFIPSGFGLAITICGVLAMQEHLRKHAMHVAALLGVIGTLAPLGRLIPALLKGGGSPVALGSQAIMALLCGILVVMCVQSFIAARKAQASADDSAQLNDDAGSTEDAV
ncbi:hypothetical protein [Calycomorphotria hydatis]|uniref:Uncharacterized protein n=1 Tax=Calycomorphotria hydatis TaxID=2528027 RepID=A0A517T8B6_9PLAN|nr:hypothetical protein [Calycomorphotria hydatis]QDT64625.1 hypothetical protein V22_18650 [Calycomorphotria hydatis]